MTATKKNVILRTVDLQSPFPTVACITKAGTLVLRFDGDQIYVSTPWGEQAKEIGLAEEGEPSIVVNGIPYNGWVCLQDQGWGDDPSHDSHHSCWRRQRSGEPGWLDRAYSANWTRTGTISGEATSNAKEKLRQLAEDVTAELVASRPALVDRGIAADLMRQIAGKEEDLEETERKAHGLQTEIEDLRNRLEEMSK